MKLALLAPELAAAERIAEGVPEPAPEEDVAVLGASEVEICLASAVFSLRRSISSPNLICLFIY